MLTIVYGALVYAETSSFASVEGVGSCNAGCGYYAFVYAAKRYAPTEPPTIWYNPEELGIVEIIEYAGENWVHIVVELEKEPFPLQREQPIFKYNDEFYRVLPVWVTPGLPENPAWWFIPAGSALTGLWIFVGVLAIKERRTKREE